MRATRSKEDLTLLFGEEVELVRSHVHDNPSRSGKLLHLSILPSVSGERMGKLAKSLFLGAHCLLTFLCDRIDVANSAETLQFNGKEVSLGGCKRAIL